MQMIPMNIKSYISEKEKMRMLSAVVVILA